MITRDQAPLYRSREVTAGICDRIVTRRRVEVRVPHGLAARTFYLAAGFLCAMLLDVACPGLHRAEGAQASNPRAHLTVSGVLTVVEIPEEIASPGFLNTPSRHVRHAYEVNTMRFDARPGSDLDTFLKAKTGMKVAILIGPAE